jgi:hypothetical protein
MHGVIHTFCTGFFFFRRPLLTFFFPGRVAFRTLLLYIGCIFLSCARFKPVSTISPRPRRRFSMSNALYLDEICTHLTSKATFTLYAPHFLDTLE